MPSCQVTVSRHGGGGPAPANQDIWDSSSLLVVNGTAAFVEDSYNSRRDPLPGAQGAERLFWCRPQTPLLWCFNALEWQAQSGAKLCIWFRLLVKDSTF